MLDCGAGMACLVVFHLLQNCPAFFVLRRQPVEVAREVAFDLALSLGQKTQAPLVAQQSGGGLKREQVDRAIHLSAEKYCSASIMLAKTAAITHDFEIRETRD